MHILCVALAAVNQFTAILDRLRVEHDVTVLAPPATGQPEGMEVYNFEPSWSRSAGTAERTRKDFLDTAAAVQEAASLMAAHVDLVFGQASWGCTYALREILRVPVVSHVELPGLEMKASRSEFPLSQCDRETDRVRRKLVNDAVRRSTLTITPSKYARSLLANDVQAHVRPCMEGFPQEPMKSRQELHRVRQQLGLPPERPIVGFFGRTLEAVRGFDIFAAASKIIRHRRPETLFLVIGKPVTHYGNEAGALDEESFRDYALRQTGLKEDDFLFLPLQPMHVFRALVAVTDVALFPIFENAGNWSFFETLAVGTPSVSADGCFFPEVITDGENGYLCPVRDVNAFADKALAILRDQVLRERLRRAAWATLAENYTVEHAARRYAEVFEEAIHSTNRASPSSSET